MKLTVTKSKNSAHFYVQKSIRKNGSTTTFTVEKLGNLDEVRARAGGKDPYQWAQEYVDELNRKEYEDRKEVIVKFAPSSLLKKDQQKTYNCGYLFLQKIFCQLGLDRICNDISKRHGFSYDLGDILSRLVYTRILYPSSKLKAHQQSKVFLEAPSFELHDVYRALSVLSGESDFIQSELYRNSQESFSRNREILYYDCTNYYFELEEEDDFRRYGHSKQHQPLPIVGMGMFMDHDGIPLAFDLFPGNRNEQPTLKPLELKVLKDFGIRRVIVCTDAGLSSMSNRKLNDASLNGEQIRSFITTQSIRKLPEDLKAFSLDPTGWRLPGDDTLYDLTTIDEDACYDKVFYKDRWITEDLGEKERKEGARPLEQHLVVSYSIKYRNYQKQIRQNQVGRAVKLLDGGESRLRAKSQNDPGRFIASRAVTDDGELCTKTISFLDEALVSEESRYDGFYAVCTNEPDLTVPEIIKVNRQRWQIEECFRIMKTEFKARPVYLQNRDRIRAHFLTCFISLVIYRFLEKQLNSPEYTCESIIRTLRDMTMFRPGEKMGYIPSYTRTDLTDALHENAGFRTDYEIIKDADMRKVIRQSKGIKK